MHYKKKTTTYYLICRGIKTDEPRGPNKFALVSNYTTQNSFISGNNISSYFVQIHTHINILCMNTMFILVLLIYTIKLHCTALYDDMLLHKYGGNFFIINTPKCQIQ